MQKRKQLLINKLGISQECKDSSSTKKSINVIKKIKFKEDPDEPLNR
jgi:hypothetical protein